MDKPLVSVIIPCYNNARHIATSIDSVLSQDYPSLEIIVVNDGSTDNSIEVLNQYADRIKLLTQENQGPAAARNTGIKAARGDYIAFNDGDDIWLPGKINAQIQYLENTPQTGLCYTSWVVWDQTQPLPEFLANLPKAANTTELVADRSGWLYTRLLAISAVCTITVMIRADIVRTVGLFNKDYAIGEDHDYWIRVSRLCQIDKLTGIYAIYRKNPNSTTQKVHPQNYSLQVLQAALNNYGRTCPSGKQVSQSQVNSYLGERNFAYGYNAMLKGHRQKAFESFKACIRLRYRLLKACIFLLISSKESVYKLFYKSPSKEN